MQADVSGVKPQTQKILLVDDDDSIRHTFVAELNRLGFKNIIEAENGQEAWDILKTEDISLVLTDWKMPIVTGLGLVNKIRQSKKTQNLPILILTGYLSRDDFRLLDEYSLIDKLEKPFSRQALSDKITSLIKEKKWLQEQSKNIVHIFKNLSTNTAKTVKEFENALQNSPRPLPVAMEGIRILQNNQLFQEAEKITRTILNSDPNCLVALNELGKCYLQQHKFTEAIVVLQQAHELCPQSVERLCLLGKAELNIKENEKAKKNFEAALEIDPTSKRAKGGFKIAENIDQFIKNSSPNEINRSLASILNSIGIASVKDGKLEEGLEHYKSAYHNVSCSEDKAKLSFNLALGLVRFDRHEEAISWFEKSIALANGHYEKASRNLENVRSKLRLANSTNHFESPNDEADILGSSGIDPSPSDLISSDFEDNIDSGKSTGLFFEDHEDEGI